MPAPCILIVDDEPRHLRFTSAVVRSSMKDVMVEICSSGEEALTLMRANSYDAILSDIQMPGMSGIELAQKSRVMKPKPTILLMTGRRALLRPALESGAYTCLPKPLPIDYAIKAIDRALKLSRLRGRVEEIKQQQKQGVDTKMQWRKKILVQIAGLDSQILHFTRQEAAQVKALWGEKAS